MDPHPDPAAPDHPDDPGGSGGSGVRVYLPAEVADLFRVDVKTVARWAAAGRISSFRTPGGHRRYPADPINAHLATTRGDHTTSTIR